MKYKIALAEDNRMERRNIEFIVNSIPDCEICATFPDGQSALEWLRENEADILITDIQMPVLNGVELIRSVVDENIDVGKIVISAYSDFEDARSLLDCEISGYVMKPFVDNELEEAIFKTIEAVEKKIETENKMNKLMIDFEKMRPILIDNFFRSLILMPKNDKAYVRKNEEMLNITLSGRYKTVLSVSIMDEEKKFDYYMYSILTDVISDKSTDEIKCYPLMLNENEVTVVVLHDKNCNVISFAVEMKNTIIDKLGIDIFIGVSKSDYEIAALNVLYNQSRSIIRNHSGAYKNVVIPYNTIDECENEHELSMDALQYELRNVVLSGDEEAGRKLIEKYIHSENSKVWRHNFSFCYVNILEIILNEVGDSFNNLIGYEKVWESLAKFDSIINLEQWLYNLTSGVIYAMKNSNVNEKLLANKVMKVIEDCYNQKISVKYIADKLSFSREYLHRVFVHVTGVSVLEYLTKYRVERAKEFLLEGFELDAVVEMVGYSDKAYFSRIFKKYTGISPIDYKKL